MLRQHAHFEHGEEHDFTHRVKPTLMVTGFGMASEFHGKGERKR
jgi:hypothetical protein